MNTPPTPPWDTTPTLLQHKKGTWQPVDEKTLASEKSSAILMHVLGRIAGLRPPFGHSIFTNVLQLTPGTIFTGEEIMPHPQEARDSGTRTLENAERVLADSLSRHGARGIVQSALPVDPLVTRYLSSITSQQGSQEETTTVVDARGVRDLIGATEGESRKTASSSSSNFLQRLLNRSSSKYSEYSNYPKSSDAEPTINLDPQWLTPDAVYAIDVAQVVSLTSWQDAVKDLSPRVTQLLWTAAEDPAGSSFTPYRPAHDPEVLAAFAQVPAMQRAITLPNGLRTLDAALCQRYGRDPVDDHAAARLQAVREASQAWPQWEEELAEGSLAARGLIDTDGMRHIGQDPFLRQKYALSIKRTVETERWVTSWLDAGGSLTD